MPTKSRASGRFLTELEASHITVPVPLTLLHSYSADSMSDYDDTSCTSEVYEADSTTQANHIARDPELFESWATLVSLDTSIRTSTEDFPETLRDLLQASRVIPPWIINPVMCTLF